MSSHAPGPWTVAAHTAESPDEITPGCDWTVYGADGVSVCFEGAWNKHANANVRLICAAPDLLDALNRIVDYYDTELPGDVISQAKDAIAKTQGTEK